MDAALPDRRGPAADRDQLRVVACGAVDDGKSTLIGRLLVETGSVPDDQLDALAALSRRYGGATDLDYALLLDGLEAEREQGITIDVAHRYFGTSRRAFVVADTPGHVQYTRNMLTGASTADLALLLVDARSGITTQTMRHSRIASLVGIRHVLLVVNKMDLVDYAEQAFAAVDAAYRGFAGPLGFSTIAAVPVSARHGDNVTAASARLFWYRGATVLEHLESVETKTPEPGPLRFLVQSVVRDGQNFRGHAGFLASGELSSGDLVTVARSGIAARVERIVTFDGDLARAKAGDAVTIAFADAVDIGRGDVLAHPGSEPVLTDQFAAHLVWLDEHPLLPARFYLLRIGTQTVPASITSLRHKVDVETGGLIAGRTLEMNDIGFCNLSTAVPVALDPYAENHGTGAFILIDRDSAATVGAGMVDHPLRRAGNVRRQSFDVDKTIRARQKGQRPCIVWFTGLPGAGKSTIMNLVEQRLAARGAHTYSLDGDNLRRGLNRDLGFTDADRVENIRRAGEVARLMVDAGLVVLCAFISPFAAERRMVRELVRPDEFFEIFVDTPLEECIARDPKGLYGKARRGLVRHVTGLDSPYEAPEAAELRLVTTAEPAERLADRVVEELQRRGVIDR
jgi:bifunctional enzyme CysN/CysC